jgi:hypothetical protein
LIRELLLLERSPQRSGKDSISHPRNGHDDYANSVCGLLSMLAGKRSWSSLSGDAWTATRLWAATPQRSSDTSFWPMFGKSGTSDFTPTPPEPDDHPAGYVRTPEFRHQFAQVRAEEQD